MIASKKFLISGILVGITTVLGSLALYVALSVNISSIINGAPQAHRSVESKIGEIRVGITTLTKEQQADKMTAILNLDKSSVSIISGLESTFYIIIGLLAFLGLVVICQSILGCRALSKHE